MLGLTPLKPQPCPVCPGAAVLQCVGLSAHGGVGFWRLESMVTQAFCLSIGQEVWGQVGSGDMTGQVKMRCLSHQIDGKKGATGAVLKGE